MIAHGTPEGVLPRQAAGRAALPLPDDGAPTVAVLGAIGPDKGARRLERLVSLARARGAWVRFVLIGYMDVEHGPWQSGDAMFTVHGRYDPADLRDLLVHYRVAARPLSFSGAGNIQLHAFRGLGVRAARARAADRRTGRARARQRSGLGDDRRRSGATKSGCWNGCSRYSARRTPRGRDKASAAALAMPHASLHAMTEATFACYDAAVALPQSAQLPPSLQPTALQPFPNARVRDALGYRAVVAATAATGLSWHRRAESADGSHTPLWPSATSCLAASCIVWRRRPWSRD